MGRLRALAALAALLGAAEAFAHAQLVAAMPADGAVLDAPPAEIHLHFSEPVTPIFVRLRDASGGEIALPAPAMRGAELRIVAPDALRAGGYLLSYRVTSLDSHPVGGSIQFSIGAPAGAVGIATEPKPGWEWATATMRWLHYCGLLAAAGGALFVVLIAPFPAQARWLTLTALFAMLTAAAAVGLQGAALLDAARSELFSGAVWQAGLRSTRGTSAIVAIASMVFLIAGVALRGRVRTGALSIAAATAIVSLLLTGHTAAATPRTPNLLLHGAHALAAAFWAGSLAALWLTLRAAPGDEAVRALRQFSRRALVAVWILIAAAIMLVAFRLPNPEAVFLSRYGNLVLAKAALLGVLLALAALNRFRFVPARALPALRRSIGGEIAAMLGVLAVTAVLAQTPPPRAAAIEHAWRATLGTGDRLVELTLSPHHPGANTVLLRFRDRHDAPFDPHEVVIEIANSAAGVEPYVRQARRTAAGEYRLDGAPFAVAGNWSLRVDARVGDFDKLVFRTEVPIH